LDKCQCPFHVEGKHHGLRVRQALNTRSRRLAERRLTALLRKLDEQRQLEEQTDEATSLNPRDPRTLPWAAERFLKSHGAINPDGGYHGDIERSSFRKYQTKLNLLSSFCDREGISELVDVNLDVLEDYRGSRHVEPVTWKVELQALRTFFGYCVSHKWITVNPAREMKSPRNIKPNEVVPYTLHEEGEILAACDRIGGTKYKRSMAVYERLRARGMVLLLRHTALRISDVCTLPSGDTQNRPSADT
jgi:integrase